MSAILENMVEDMGILRLESDEQVGETTQDILPEEGHRQSCQYAFGFGFYGPRHS